MSGVKVVSMLRGVCRKRSRFDLGGRYFIST